MELLALEDYRGALTALESEADPELRLDGEAQLFLLASDYAAALGAAEAGLQLNPQNLNLRFRAASSALWLGAGQRALVHSEALATAIGGAGLGPSDSEAWSRLATSFAGQAQDILNTEEDRRGAVSFARGVSLWGLGLVLVALAWALRPGQFRSRSGSAGSGQAG